MKKLKAACLIGDYYHDPVGVEAMLRPILESSGIEGAFFTDQAAFPWTGLGGYDVVLIAKEARAEPGTSTALWSTEETEGALADWVGKGGKLFALHNGLASFTADGTYSRLVKGRFLFHPQEHPRFRIRETASGGPALEGFESFEIEDEMYFVFVDSANTEVILRTWSPDYGSSAAAWRHRVGSGRVFCYTVGHNPAVLANEAHRAVIRGGFGWLSAR
jgi:type 1 glutamine amidotransferase